MMKISKKCQKSKKMDTHWKNLLELTVRQQQSTEIHKKSKNADKNQQISIKIRTKISRNRQQSFKLNIQWN